MTGSIEYIVVKALEPVEVRKYPPMTLATVGTPYDDAAFSILFNYISGDNEPGERIAMTAPVISQRVRGERIAMTTPVISDDPSFSFVLPAKYNIKTAPRPRDQRIRILEVPSRLVAVVRFSGRAYARDVIDMEKVLLDALDKHHIRSKGAPFLMRYNSPFAPGFMRRNEVGVEVVSEDLEQGR